MKKNAFAFVCCLVLLSAINVRADCPGGLDPWGLDRPPEWVQTFTLYFPADQSIVVVHRDICRGDPTKTGDPASLQFWWADTYCVDCIATQTLNDPSMWWWIPPEKRIYQRRRAT